jgi:hypothetical protein
LYFPLEAPSYLYPFSVSQSGKSVTSKRGKRNYYTRISFITEKMRQSLEIRVRNQLYGIIGENPRNFQGLLEQIMHLKKALHIPYRIFVGPQGVKVSFKIDGGIAETSHRRIYF